MFCSKQNKLLKMTHPLLSGLWCPYTNLMICLITEHVSKIKQILAMCDQQVKSKRALSRFQRNLIYFMTANWFLSICFQSKSSCKWTNSCDLNLVLWTILYIAKLLQILRSYGKLLCLSDGGWCLLKKWGSFSTSLIFFTLTENTSFHSSIWVLFRCSFYKNLGTSVDNFWFIRLFFPLVCYTPISLERRWFCKIPPVVSSSVKSFQAPC